MNEYKIIHLPKEQWKGTPIMMVTRSDSYYDVEISPMDEKGCRIQLVRKKAEKEIVRTIGRMQTLTVLWVITASCWHV